MQLKLEPIQKDKKRYVNIRKLTIKNENISPGYGKMGKIEAQMLKGPRKQNVP